MKRTVVEVNKRRIELSNLEKVLFPDEGIIKAEVIEYYLKVAPTMLRHIKGRPLSLVRYPDGITGEAFFQKQRPDWTPVNISFQVLGNGDANYLSTALIMLRGTLSSGSSRQCGTLDS